MIDQTNLDIGRTAASEEFRHYPKRRRSYLLQAIDELLWELEELNLLGRDRVPARVRRESAALFVAIRGAGELEVRFRVPAMMEVLYRAQELVFKEVDPNYRGEEEDDQGEQSLPA